MVLCVRSLIFIIMAINSAVTAIKEQVKSLIFDQFIPSVLLMTIKKNNGPLIFVL